MRRLAMPLVALGLLTLVARADDKPTPAAAALAELKKSFKEDKEKYATQVKEKRQELQKALQEAKTDEEKKEINKKLLLVINPTDGPGPAYSLKFLALAKENAKDPAALESIKMAMQTSGGPFLKDGSWAKILDEVRAHHLNDPEIRTVVRQLGGGAFDDASEKLLRDIASKNTDRKTQAYAYKAIASSKDAAVRAADQIQQNKDVRENVEERLGKEFVAKVIADADKNRQAAEEARKILKDRYADVFPDLSVGKAAPEVVSKDINGEVARLSALKGKVVVLDIWATWCGPCRAMIPHERDMVEKLKDKPFVLVSISADAEKQTLTDFLAKEKMPWTHWWNGSDGGIIEDWEVTHYPTIYVLDAKGVIRFKEIRGKALEEAVEGLLKEAETK